MTKITDLRDRPLIFLDLETTGLDPQFHEIIEIGAVKVDGKTFRQIKELHLKVKPAHEERIDQEAQEISGYNKLEWEDAIELSNALKSLADFLGTGIIIGWNVAFDWAFLEKAFHEYGVDVAIDYHRLDVMSMAYSKLYANKEMKELKMRKIAKILNITVPEKHGALVDAQAAYQIFLELMQ